MSCTQHDSAVVRLCVSQADTAHCTSWMLSSATLLSAIAKCAIEVHSQSWRFDMSRMLICILSLLFCMLLKIILTCQILMTEPTCQLRDWKNCAHDYVMHASPYQSRSHETVSRVVCRGLNIEFLMSIVYVIACTHTLTQTKSKYMNICICHQKNIFWCVKGTHFWSPLHQHSKKKVHRVMK